MMEPTTGDAVKLTVATTGHNSKVEVNDEMMPGVTSFSLNVAIGEATRLTIRAFHPWPRHGEKAQTQTFIGYFVERADWQAFDEWRKARAE